MTWGRRTTGALALAAVASVVTGCGAGEGSQAEPTPVVIPGSTVTIGTEPVESPSEPPAAAEEPTSGPTEAEDEAVADAPALVAQVGAAMGRFETVHLSVGDEDGPFLEADHLYLGGNDYAATDVSGAGFEYRRIDGAFYLRLDPEGGWARAEAEDFVEGDTSQETGLFRWDVLADLAAPLSAAQDFTARGPDDVDGTAVTSYTFTVDAADVVDGAHVPDLVTGPVEVTLSVDAENLPVRLDQRLVDSSQVVRTDYRDWGLPVDVEVPPDAVDVS